ncbi:meiotic recombination protein REC8 homolog [Diretmus argenteus]
MVKTALRCRAFHRLEKAPCLHSLLIYGLVATKGIKVPRRDFLKVNVESTCDDIMDYVLERVPPPPGLPLPRFSLYLSSQLQYGVNVLFSWRISRPLQNLLIPDALSLLDMVGGAPDPLFGLMSFQDPVPSPSTLIQTYMIGASPEHPERTGPATPPQDGISASPDSITLREREPVVIPAAEVQLSVTIHT